MNYALKLQATIGDVTKFDCTGGEPQDQHRTIAEQDPADPATVSLLDATLGELADQLGRDVYLGQWINDLLGDLGVSYDIPGFGKARVQIRKMDSDGKE